MPDLTLLTAFFGWCSLINIIVLLGLFARGKILRNIAADLFQVSAEQINLAYLNLLLQYRNGTLLLSVTPYIALKLLAWDS